MEDIYWIVVLMGGILLVCKYLYEYLFFMYFLVINKYRPSGGCRIRVNATY